MRKKIAAGNWKMNTTVEEGKFILEKLLKASFTKNENREIIVIPPFTHLTEFDKILAGSHIRLGAQNIYHEKAGAFTGEISALMIKSVGADYVVIGHSERRRYFNESNSLLASKINLALDQELIPIYCCGESEDERDKNIYFSIIEKQVKEGLFHLDESSVKKIVIAYEPVWAIGTGKNATPMQAQEVHAFIRALLKKKYGYTVAADFSIIYGGSIKASNASLLFSQPDIDGGLVGGASLNADEFVQIIEKLIIDNCQF